MPWYMPTYGRPHRLSALLDAPGGWPDKVICLVNEDDPCQQQYIEALRNPWTVSIIPAGSRCADAHRWISTTWPDEDYYGLLCDDQWPVTRDWHSVMVEAAGKWFISGANDCRLFPKLRTALVIGGELARAMGSLVLPPVHHNYEDDFWDMVAADHGLLKPLKDIVVEHRHWSLGAAERDATYARGSTDLQEDKAVFSKWKASAERKEMDARIRKTRPFISYTEWLEHRDV